MDLATFMVSFTAAFTGLFVIMDPFVSIPVLLGVSKGEPEEVMRNSADQAVAVAGGLIFVFIFFGVLILDSLDISIDALKVGGGIILMLLGLELVLGFSWSKDEEGKHKDTHAAAIIIGTPLITGPGVLTTTIVYVTEYGYIVTIAAALLSVFVTWIILRQCYRINKVIGPQVISVISKIMGMLLVAMSIQFIISGLDVLLKLGLGQG
jgi:multiple antibiotic resistance protein